MTFEQWLASREWQGRLFSVEGDQLDALAWMLRGARPVPRADVPALPVPVGTVHADGAIEAAWAPGDAEKGEG